MTGDTVHVSLAIKFLKSLLEDNLNTLEQFSDNQTILIQVRTYISYTYATFMNVTFYVTDFLFF